MSTRLYRYTLWMAVAKLPKMEWHHIHTISAYSMEHAERIFREKGYLTSKTNHYFISTKTAEQL